MSDIRLKKGGWVVVADGERALFLVNEGTVEKPDLAVFREMHQDNPLTREQGVDRPGRLSDGMGSHHRSAVQESDWHRVAKHEFAREIMAKLSAMGKGAGQIVLVAPPVVLGEMRKHVPAELAGRIVAEVDKDLTKHPVGAIAEILLS